MQILLALLLVVVAMVFIMFNCDSFEPAADFLGKEVYKMPPGVRGASIEAVASSLPEFFTTMFLLFLFHDEDGFAAGVATCAGSVCTVAQPCLIHSTPPYLCSLFILSFLLLDLLL